MSYLIGYTYKLNTEMRFHYSKTDEFEARSAWFERLTFCSVGDVKFPEWGYI